jgi:hypothetical protein
MPKENKEYLTFKNYHHRHFIPFTIYYDTEAMLKKIEDDKGNYQLHLARNFGVHIVSRYSNLIKSCYKNFYGVDCVLEGLKYIMDLHDELIELCKNTNIKMIITEEQEKEFKKATICYLCNKDFKDENDEKFKKNKIKVRDHDHLNGLYRGAAH